MHLITRARAFDFWNLQCRRLEKTCKPIAPAQMANERETQRPSNIAEAYAPYVKYLDVEQAQRDELLKVNKAVTTLAKKMYGQPTNQPRRYVFALYSART